MLYAPQQAPSAKEYTMNLRYKLQHKLTAVIQLNDNRTSAIFSDECSPNAVNTLVILEASSPKKLRKKCEKRAIKLAKPTRFKPVQNRH